ncbi:cytochrome P450 [Hyalangium rubrum]|uniref:Cytochrome P450 n=1 Tax=Hyalangium rubrum TaxID=3103134 RepID=A0ABU5GYT6_9BACT|nr:cytochrome P450 [Hyalangium sp. s54d21]MDY7226044.1 cytochrome P450 [Hyalangium sp. s54d21]
MTTPAAAQLGLEYKPLEAPQLNDPFPFYARLRHEAPVTFAPAFQLWLVSRYADVQAALRDPKRFSSRDILRPPVDLPPEMLEYLKEAGYSPEYPLLGDDPPSHTRIRGLVGKAFSVASVAAMETRIREIARSYVDALLRAGPRADVVAGLSFPLPMHIITTLLGIPASDGEKLKGWCADENLFFVPHLPPEARMHSARGVAAFRHYLRAMVEERQKNPRPDDFLTSLIQARLEGERPLNLVELINLSSVIVFAGHETTTNLMSSALLYLLRHPTAWQELRANPAALPNAIDEVLRFDTPVVGMMRTATEDVELSSTQVPAGARLLLLFASANRDEAIFPEGAERLDIHRANANRHIGFGHGAHYCVGAQLAKLEMRIALEMLLERLPNPRLVPEKPVPYLPALIHRGPRQLWVEWDAA